MVTIKNNKIVMTRGDSLNAKIGIVRNKFTKSKSIDTNPTPDGREFLTPEDLEGCRLRFAMSEFYPGDLNYKLLLAKELPTQTMALILNPEDTKTIPLGIYNYDVKLISPPESPADREKVDTFISGTIQLLGDCEGEESLLDSNSFSFDYDYDDYDGD